MDTAMEQSVTLQGHRLQWEFPENTNKLCHRCGKLGCAPTAYPLNNSRGRSRTRNPVAHLKERFNIGRSNNHDSSVNCNRHRSRSQSKDRSNSRQRNHSANNTGRSNNNTNNTSSPNPSNSNKSIQSAQQPRSNERKGKDRSVSFFTSQRNSTFIPNSSGHKQPFLVYPNCSQIQEILSVLKSLQEDMASVRARIHALELADQRMSRLELRVFGHKQDDVLPPDPNNSSYMLVDNHQSTPLI
ncbi:hypothetical protein RIR_jg30392.t1 [Rhizophagus irregularis DAOM 181602=DAOM 197198]|nr:hypothetical protein RIR_jg30392.t1 [Rhizophagus irregularis DAOM 181602=DAOM 197198]